MKLEPEFSYTAELAEPQIVGPGPYGLRQVLAVTGGKVTGNRFSGTAAPGLTGGTTGTDFGDHYFVTTPRLESGDPRYSWVNQSIFVGQGRIQPGPVVEFQVFRVTP